MPPCPRPAGTRPTRARSAPTSSPGSPRRPSRPRPGSGPVGAEPDSRLPPGETAHSRSHAPCHPALEPTAGAPTRPPQQAPGIASPTGPPGTAPRYLGVRDGRGRVQGLWGRGFGPVEGGAPTPSLARQPGLARRVERPARDPTTAGPRPTYWYRAAVPKRAGRAMPGSAPVGGGSQTLACSGSAARPGSPAPDFAARAAGMTEATAAETRASAPPTSSAVRKPSSEAKV